MTSQRLRQCASADKQSSVDAARTASPRKTTTPAPPVNNAESKTVPTPLHWPPHEPSPATPSPAPLRHPERTTASAVVHPSSQPGQPSTTPPATTPPATCTSPSCSTTRKETMPEPRNRTATSATTQLHCSSTVETVDRPTPPRGRTTSTARSCAPSPTPPIPPSPDATQISPPPTTPP